MSVAECKADCPFAQILKFADNSPVVIQHQDAALVSFVGRLASDPSVEDGPIFQTVSNWWVVVGDKDVLPALEMGIRFTECGETTAIWSHSKFAYGPDTRNGSLPANSCVRYEVSLHKVWTVEEQDQSSVKLEVCRSKKAIANDIYKNEDVNHSIQSRNRALHTYKKAADQLEQLIRQTAAEASAEQGDTNLDFDVQEARNLHLDCLNNIAAVHLQCKAYHAAKESCVAVLQHDPHNFKGLLRAAKAALLDPASSYEEVDEAIKAASEQCHENEEMQADVQRLMMDFLRRKNAYKQREKNMYSKMAKATVTGSNRNESNSTDEINTEKAVSASGEGDETAAFFMHRMKQVNWTTILSYMIQLTIPFAVYYCITALNKGQSAFSDVEEL